MDAMTVWMLLVGGCGGPAEPIEVPEPEVEVPPFREVRFATYNTSLFREAAGGLVADLSDPDHAQARQVAAVLQQVRPDVVLLNEVDFDEEGRAAALLRSNFLEVSQDGREPLHYPHAFLAPVNTGVHSGFDLDRDGAVTAEPGSRAYGGDAFGFGTHPGQYGMLVLSRFPIDEEAARTFQTFLWKDVPEPGLPDGWYAPEALEVFRLSSKSHWDLPIRIDEHTIHLLASHPTPPVFDGPEDRNGKRNDAEIRFWVDYLSGGGSSWHVDDAGKKGGLGDASFVLVGDLNADPHDGDTAGGAISALVAHERVGRTLTPRSEGAVEAAGGGGRNAEHKGDPAEDTADFDDARVGNLRVDYALPSADLEVVAGGVFWPVADSPLAPLLEASDHRPVWVDVRLPRAGR